MQMNKIDNFNNIIIIMIIKKRDLTEIKFSLNKKII